MAPQYSELEVVPNESSEFSQLPRVSIPPSYPEVVGTKEESFSSKEVEEINGQPKSQRRLLSRKWLWIVGSVVLLVIIAAVVGGVVGSRSKKKTVPASASNTTDTKPTTTAPAQMSGTAVPKTGYYYPTAVSWGYPHLEVYTTSQNHSNFIKYRGVNTSDTTWQPSDGSLATIGGTDANFDTSVSAISRRNGTTDVFITGNETTSFQAGHIYHDRTGFPTNSDGSPRFDGPDGTMSFITAPAQTSWDAERLDAFLLGTDNALYQITWTKSGGWQAIARLGGNWSTFVPAAVSWGENRIDVFVVDPNTKELYHTFFDNGSWQPAPTGFESLGGHCTSRPIAVSWGSRRIDVFVRGGDAGLWHITFDGTTWSSWSSTSGNTTIQGEPEAVSWGDNHLDVFAWGADGSLLHKSYTELTPSADSMEVLGGGLGGPPKAVSDAPGSVHVFCFSRFGALQHMWFNTTEGVWGPGPGNFEQLGTPKGGI